MPGHDLDWLIQVVREAFPPDDDQIPESVEVVALLMDELPDFVEFGPGLRRMKREGPTDDWGEQQDQSHHDGPRAHATAS